MKKATLILLLCAMVFGAQAQKFSIALGGGYQHMFYGGKKLNQFVDSYNSTVIGLSQPMENFSKSLSGRSLNLTFYYTSGSFATTLDLFGSYFEDGVSARWNDGRGRDIDLKYRDWNMQILFGADMGDIGAIGGILGFSWRIAQLRSYSVYADGSRSISPEYALNGYYKGMSSSADVGMAAYIYPYKYVMLQVRAWYQLPFLAFDDMSDYGSGRGWITDYFPQDYERYDQALANGDYDYENAMIADFRGFNINISVLVNLPILWED